jgi:hypothetical protein
MGYPLIHLCHKDQTWDNKNATAYPKKPRQKACGDTDQDNSERVDLGC